MQLTNASAVVVKTYTYEAFGALIAQSGSVVNPYQFQTKQFSASTGFNHFGFRSYNPTVGRFTTADPLGFVNGPNLYAYVGNNPLNWIDPWGLKKEKPWWEEAWEWYAYESVLPGPYGQPISEWGPNGPTGWGDPMKYTEQAGGWWKWGERIMVGTSAVAALTAGGLMGYEALTGIRIEFHLPHKVGPHGYPHLQKIKGPEWGKTVGRWPKAHPWWWPK